MGQLQRCKTQNATAPGPAADELPAAGEARPAIIPTHLCVGGQRLDAGFQQREAGGQHPGGASSSSLGGPLPLHVCVGWRVGEEWVQVEH